MFYKLCCDFWILSFNTQILYKIQKWIHFHVILNKRYNNKQVLIQTRCLLPKVSSCCLYQQRTVEHHHPSYIFCAKIVYYLLFNFSYYLVLYVWYISGSPRPPALPWPHIVSPLCTNTRMLQTKTTPPLSTNQSTCQHKHRTQVDIQCSVYKFSEGMFDNFLPS